MIPDPTPDDLKRDAEADYEQHSGRSHLKWALRSLVLSWVRRATASEKRAEAAERERDQLRDSSHFAELANTSQLRAFDAERRADALAARLATIEAEGRLRGMEEAAKICWTISDELASRDDMTSEQGMAQHCAAAIRAAIRNINT